MQDLENIKLHILLPLLVTILAVLFLIAPESTKLTIKSHTQTAGLSFDTDLISHYTFDNTAVDSQGSNNGTLVGGPTYTTGKIESAVSLDGSDDHIESSTIEPTNVTVSAWVKTDETTSSLKGIVSELAHGGGAPGTRYYGYVLAKSGWGSDWKYVFIVGSGGDNSDSATEDTVRSSSNPIPSDTDWHHLVGTYDGTTAYLYVDGVLQSDSSTQAITYHPHDDGVKIGRYYSDQEYGLFHFNGSIDDVRIYNRALTASEITELYNYTGTPAQTCTSFTYTNWTPTTCPVNETQTRTVLTSSPSGCTGGTPNLTQSCTYIPTSVCGNAIIETGESCDLGSQNGICPSTCSSSCTTNTCTVSTDTYYISPDHPNRSDDNLGTSSNAPWATFTEAIPKLVPGDTLILQDGTYHESLNITVSGQVGNPITIKALNDGKAIIDGQGNKQTVRIVDNSYLNIEGLRLQNSYRGAGGNAHAVQITGDSHYIQVREVTVYPFADNIDNGDANDFMCNWWPGGVSPTNILFEDVASPHSHSRTSMNFQHCDNVTVRRGYINLYFMADAVSDGGGAMSFYHTGNSLAENVIAKFRSEGHEPPEAPWTRTWFHGGFNIHCNFGPPASNTSILGSVMLGDGTLNDGGYADVRLPSGGNHCNDIQGTNATFKNNFFYENLYGILIDGFDDSEISNNTVVSNGNNSNQFGVLISRWNDQPQNTEVNFKNNMLLSNYNGLYVDNDSKVTVENTYNAYFDTIGNDYSGKASAGVGETSAIDPNYDTNTYGLGAYLMTPTALQGQGEGGADIGAEILYYSVNGQVLSNNKLWPWSLENRIQDETYEIYGECSSVTYESTPKHDNPSVTCTGGLWKTLDGVYDGIPQSPTLTADLNSDGTVNSLDWSILNANWNTGNPTADINNDGTVNSLDWSIMNSNWS